jgi:hypothetical protein
MALSSAAKTVASYAVPARPRKLDEALWSRMSERIEPHDAEALSLILSTRAQLMQRRNHAIRECISAHYSHLGRTVAAKALARALGQYAQGSFGHERHPA